MSNEDDLYSDLPEETTSDYLAKLETELKSIRKELDKMDTALTNSEKERKELQRLNETLKRNMSSLFKTAQSEIKRKENEISELRTQYEDMVFRRKENHNSYKHRHSSPSRSYHHRSRQESRNRRDILSPRDRSINTKSYYSPEKDNIYRKRNAERNFSYDVNEKCRRYENTDYFENELKYKPKVNERSKNNGDIMDINNEGNDRFKHMPSETYRKVIKSEIESDRKLDDRIKPTQNDKESQNRNSSPRDRNINTKSHHSPGKDNIYRRRNAERNFSYDVSEKCKKHENTDYFENELKYKLTVNERNKNNGNLVNINDELNDRFKQMPNETSRKVLKGEIESNRKLDDHIKPTQNDNSSKIITSQTEYARKFDENIKQTSNIVIRNDELNDRFKKIPSEPNRKILKGKVESNRKLDNRIESTENDNSAKIITSQPEVAPKFDEHIKQTPNIVNRNDELNVRCKKMPSETNRKGLKGRIESNRKLDNRIEPTPNDNLSKIITSQPEFAPKFDEHIKQMLNGTSETVMHDKINPSLKQIPYDTPRKFINGEIELPFKFSFNLVTPLRDTPDYLKEKMKASENKPHPVVPMFNEFRAMDSQETSFPNAKVMKMAECDDSNSRKSDTCNEQPIKNCAVVNITSDCSENVNSTTSVFTQINTCVDNEHGTFKRKRKRPIFKILV